MRCLSRLLCGLTMAALTTVSGTVAVNAADVTASDIKVPGGILIVEAKTAAEPLELVYADASGQPLYIAANSGEGGDFQCEDDCLQIWKPALIPEGVEAKGEWSAVEGPGGERQWAYRGKPLYTYANEAEVGVYPGGTVGEVRRRWEAQASGDGVDEIWSVIKPRPAEDIRVPTNIAVEEAVMAPGFILVTADETDPLYFFTGTEEEERNLPDGFRPLAAGMIEQPVGDFSIRRRWDGSMQWAYQDAGLYTYEGDYIAGDLNGKGIAPYLVPATVFPFFQPDKVKLAKDERRGGHFVEAETGKVLYACDRHHYPTSSYNSRILNRGNPIVGRILGVSCCDEACEGEWEPLLASADAQPNGYWEIFDRPDGKKQWAYRGYALYSYRNEPAGSFTGEEQWSYNFSQEPGDEIDEKFGLGTYWIVMAP